MTQKRMEQNKKLRHPLRTCPSNVTHISSVYCGRYLDDISSQLEYLCLLQMLSLRCPLNCICWKCLLYHSRKHRKLMFSNRIVHRRLWQFSFRFHTGNYKDCCPLVCEAMAAVYWRFRRTYCLHLQCRKIIQTRRCLLLVKLIFDPENGCSNFLWNVWKLLQETRHRMPEDGAFKHSKLLDFVTSKGPELTSLGQFWSHWTCRKLWSV